MALRTSRRNEAGFTIVELLVAMVITIAGLFAMLQAVEMVTVTNVRNQMRDEAILLGGKVLNDLMARPYEVSPPTLDSYSGVAPSRIRGVGMNYRIVGKREGIPSTDSKLVTVTVDWTFKNTPTRHTISAVKSR